MLYEIGLYGLGVMGASLAKNMINRGFATAVTSKSPAERERFAHEGGVWQCFETEQQFVQSLQKPRVIFTMITAGKPVDMVLDALIPLLDEGDVVIDGGNSYYEDTARRVKYAAEKGICFMGVGVSGGERGALEGPCMMAGGSRKGWEACGRYLQAMAAKAPDGASCCDYVGDGGAGHYVKMVHNGIEYAVMQQIADVYAILTQGYGMSAREAGAVFNSWRGTKLDSYLVDITAGVLSVTDDDGAPLVDKILDVARQKGTGMWTMLEATRRGVYTPCIDEALFTRYHSGSRDMRRKGAQVLPAPAACGLPAPTTQQLADALYLAMVSAYAQGLLLIQKASDENGWNINLPASVALWRGGCIIRSALLNDITEAFRAGETQLLFAPQVGDMQPLQQALRTAVLYAAGSGIAVPTLSAALTYYDATRTARMSVNLVQALRDCFGAHTYERIDREGTFHTRWEQEFQAY